MHKQWSILNSIVRYLLRTYHRRIMRIVCHFTPLTSRHYLPPTSWVDWATDFGAYVADMLIMPELIQIVHVFMDSESRMLTNEEKYTAQTYFGPALDLKYIYVRPRISKWIAKKAHAYVTFNAINYHRYISEAIYAHELVHIWQFQTYGSMYIFRALRAQRSSAGYDYGGFESLYRSMIDQKAFTDYNFEQQGSIIEDYVRLRRSPSQTGGPMVEATYQYYLSQLRS